MSLVYGPALALYVGIRGGYMRLILTALLITMTASVSMAVERKASPQPEFQTCSFESGEVGKLRFRGETREVAFEKTTKACLQARVLYFQVQRGSAPTTERQILFAEDCVNKTYCKR
jgi:hypothetical protein